MNKNKRDYDIKKGLKKHITIPEIVNEQVESAYQTIREQNCFTAKEKKSAVRKSMMQKLIGTAAAIVLLSTTTLAVLAANGFFSKEVIEKGDTITYKFDLDYELKPGVFEAEPAYLPEGFKEQEEDKYWPDSDWGHGITVMAIINTADLEIMDRQFSQEGVDNVEKTTLNGMEAHLITFPEAEKYRSPKYIYLFNPEEGYVLQIFGDYSVSMEELKKFADGLEVTRVEDTDFESAREKEARESEKAADEQAMTELEQNMAELIETGIQDDQLIKMGEEGKMDDTFMNAGYTVESVEYTDSIANYDINGFYDYTEVEPWLNEDKTLKPYIRQHFDEQGNLLEEKEVEQEFMVVKAKAKKYGNRGTSEEDKMTPLDACLVRLETREDGSYTWPEDYYQAVPNQDYYLQSDGRCIYMDKPQYLEGDERAHSFFWRTMESEEELEYTIIFVVDKDREDLLVLDFNGLATFADMPAYFDIRGTGK